MISEEMLKRFDMKPLSEYKKDFGDTAETEAGFYQTFLYQTNYVNNLINEEYILGATKAQLKEKYKDILEARAFARSKLEGI